jgi:hypothetical protein
LAGQTLRVAATARRPLEKQKDLGDPMSKGEILVHTHHVGWRERSQSLVVVNGNWGSVVVRAMRMAGFSYGHSIDHGRGA